MAISEWSATPTSTIWGDPANWATGVVPTQTAGFVTSTRTAITFASGAAAEIGAIQFPSNAQAFTFTMTELQDQPALTISGGGVANFGLGAQSFIVASNGDHDRPQLVFSGAASAGGGNVSYYAGPSCLETGYGGGVISFQDTSTAGSAAFTLRTGKQAPPESGSTVGGEATFDDEANAGAATFSIWGTLGTDGDTFASCSFHGSSSAGTATFTNQGGTVPSGDGGNTQFYANSTAADGVFLNFGGVAWDETNGGAYGGDVAFDGSATAANGVFNNYPGKVSGGNGGVTSFNNNPNDNSDPDVGATAGRGSFVNYGANDDFIGSGGHTEFSARHGYATAGEARIINLGSVQTDSSTGGHTIFSVGDAYSDDGGSASDYFPTAANATIWNHAGVSGGYTQFKVYSEGPPPNPPTAGGSTIYNLGGDATGQSGGYVEFYDYATAASATLIAYGGVNGGAGGRIVFADNATGGEATVCLIGDGALSLSDMKTALGLGALKASGGVVEMQVGDADAPLNLTQGLTIAGPALTFSLSEASGVTIAPDTQYPLMTAPNLADFQPGQFTANSMAGGAPVFDISSSTLYVMFVV